jgi:hypothetical protein
VDAKAHQGELLIYRSDPMQIDLQSQ